MTEEQRRSVLKVEDMSDTLVNKRVMIRTSKKRGIIKSISGGTVTVEFPDSLANYPYPGAFANTLILEDSSIQAELEEAGTGHSFDFIKRNYSSAIIREIQFLKKYRRKEISSN